MPDHETATWGDVCSTACQISFLERSRSLYETIFLETAGSFGAPCRVPAAVRTFGMAWDFMGLNDFLEQGWRLRAGQYRQKHVLFNEVLISASRN
jgi:hypothetical protein